jgi:hypothetical protein
MLHGGDVNDSTVLMFPPLIYMSTIILLKYWWVRLISNFPNWNIAESGAKHNKIKWITHIYYGKLDISRTHQYFNNIMVDMYIRGGNMSLNLCKPNTCLNWTISSVPEEINLDRFYCITNIKQLYWCS